MSQASLTANLIAHTLRMMTGYLLPSLAVTIWLSRELRLQVSWVYITSTRCTLRRRTDNFSGIENLGIMYLTKDQERAERALAGVKGKRLTYKGPRPVMAGLETPF